MYMFEARERDLGTRLIISAHLWEPRPPAAQGAGTRPAQLQPPPPPPSHDPWGGPRTPAAGGAAGRGSPSRPPAPPLPRCRSAVAPSGLPSLVCKVGRRKD